MFPVHRCRWFGDRKCAASKDYTVAIHKYFLRKNFVDPFSRGVDWINKNEHILIIVVEDKKKCVKFNIDYIVSFQEV